MKTSWLPPCVAYVLLSLTIVDARSVPADERLRRRLNTVSFANTLSIVAPLLPINGADETLYDHADHDEMVFLDAECAQNASYANFLRLRLLEEESECFVANRYAPRTLSTDDYFYFYLQWNSDNAEDCAAGVTIDFEAFCISKIEYEAVFEPQQFLTTSAWATSTSAGFSADCRNSLMDCTSTTIDCSQYAACEVLCGVCDDLEIDCPLSGLCTVDCQTEGGCSNLTINWTPGQPSELICGEYMWNCGGNFTGEECSSCPDFFTNDTIVAPTSDPTTSAGGLPLVDKGVSPVLPLNECEGDCDSDSDCAGDLKCWEQEFALESLPPGCTGTPHTDWYDYCYLAEPTTTPSPTTPSPTMLTEEFTQTYECETHAVSSDYGTWFFEHIQGDGAATRSFDSPGFDEDNVIVYVIDTAVNLDHEHFAHLADDQKVNLDPAGLTSSPLDHGTHVAGSIVGQDFGIMRGSGVTLKTCNVCPSVLGCYYSLIDTCLRTVAADLAEERSKDPRKRGVVNLSLGGLGCVVDDLWNPRFSEIKRHGGVVVVAAGNSDMDACAYSPACSAEAVTVGAYGEGYERAYFSNYGSCIDAWSPGLDILSSLYTDPTFGTLSGTSMASPLMAGMIGQLVNINNSLSTDNIKAIVGDEANGFDVADCQSTVCSAFSVECENLAEVAGVDPCADPDVCSDPFVCDASAAQFETVVNFPCKRDCDLFAIDEYLDQCSAIFPAAVEDVTALIDNVTEAVQAIQHTQLPAVTALIESNSDNIADVKEAVSVIQNSTIVGIEAQLSALGERLAFLENRVHGFGASFAVADEPDTTTTDTPSTTSSITCFAQGPCNSGYMDVTDGNYYFEFCGMNCTGGMLWTDGACNCACQPAGSCQSLSSYDNFNVYRYVPQIHFFRYLGSAGDYVAVLLAIAVLVGLLWSASKCCGKRSTKYAKINISGSEGTEEEEENEDLL